MKEKKYYGMPFHLHSCFERQASMEGHMYNAQKLGLKYIWFTDHDVRMGRKKNHIDRFDFENGLLVDDSDTIKRWYGFRTVKEENFTAILNDTDAFLGSKCMRLTAKADSDAWMGGTVEFDSSQKRHEVGLPALVTMKIAIKPCNLHEDMRVIIDIKLSQRPPDFQFGHIRYVLGCTDGLDGENYAVVPIWAASDEWTVLHCDLTKDAETVGGADNVLQTVSITVEARKGGQAECLIDALEINQCLEFEDARRAQQVVADQLGRVYEITPFVSTEISDSGRDHKIVFSTSVPILNYRERNYDISHEEGANWVHSHGGIYSLNHPFEFLHRLKRLFSPDEKQALIEEATLDYIQKRMYGATLVEIGYPEGRGQFTLADHLYLWDALSKAGVFITGYGCSDNHTNHCSWFDGNNFVAFVGSDNPCEESFVDAMKSGDLYTGDPAMFQGELSYQTEEGVMMGKVVRADRAEYTVCFSATEVFTDSKLRMIINGKVAEEVRVEGRVCYKHKMTVDAPVNFARVELYQGDRCYLLTNPIYFVTDPDIIIPKERQTL